jgi:Leucine-rich repeat (LRR) protein
MHAAGVGSANQDMDSIEADVSLPNLHVLLLGDNKLTSIESLGLSKLTNLRSLFLQNNLITCVEGLSCLTALEELV